MATDMLPRRPLFALLSAVMLTPLALFAQLQPAGAERIANSHFRTRYVASADTIAHQRRFPALPAIAPRFILASGDATDPLPRMPILLHPALAAIPDSLAFEPKSASTAFVLSFLIAGGGQLYAGETKKGVVLMVTELLGAGLVVHELATCDELLTDGCNDTKMRVGAVLALGSWIVSMAEAPSAARRYNERHARAQPLVDIEPGREARFGVRVALGR